ncbi:glycosyltransferase family 4 protein [Endothiovibrio diazotrophicus]
MVVERGGGGSLRVLFVSRAHPPVVGGIENHNRALLHHLRGVAEVHAIVNRGGKRLLPLFLPWAVLRALWTAPRVDVVLLGDGVSAVVGWAVKRLFPHKPVVCVLHGLDLTYPHPFYQRWWVGLFFRSVDRFIAVSRATAASAVSFHLPVEQVVAIPNGIDVESPPPACPRAELAEWLGERIEGRTVLLTLGRLVERKGVAWFMERVVPRLDRRVLYLVAGEGPQRARLEALLRQPGVGERVRLLGAVDERAKAVLMGGSDLFIQPNVRVPGDMEGFGITVLEAGLHGLPVVAADLEGLRDSVIEGGNGWRLPSGDADAFVRRVGELAAEDAEAVAERRQRACETVRAHFSWGRLVGRYAEVLREVSGCAGR